MYSYQDALAFSGVATAHPGGFSLTKRILKNEGIHPGSTILDGGCGTGLTAFYLAKELRCKVFAIDVHPQMIKHATARMNQEKVPVKVIKGNIENLPFPDDSFDYVVAESSTLFTDISKTLKEYYRVLKSSGVLIDIEMITKETLQKTEETRLRQFYDIKKFLTEEEWVSAFRKSGFTNVDILKTCSILQEIEEYNGDSHEQDEINNMEKIDPVIENILFEHSKLMMNFAEKLGYSVFRAIKK